MLQNLLDLFQLNFLEDQIEVKISNFDDIKVSFHAVIF